MTPTAGPSLEELRLDYEDFLRQRGLAMWPADHPALETCNKRFLCFVNNHAEHARAYYAEEASGTSLSMKNVSRPVIFALAVPLPPLAEQHRIVAKVDELMALCDALEAQLTTTANTSRQLLEAALHEALDPTKPSRPASGPAL